MTRQHPTWGTPARHFSGLGFFDERGRWFDGAVIGRAIRAEHRNLVDAHLRVQLRALGLEEAFDRGSTPGPLSFSFARPLSEDRT
jgi:hypothetical protein